MSTVVALAEGTVFASDYRIEGPLSSGGMGAVYIVEQLSTGKRRALKVMHPQLVSNPDLRRRFEREARIGSRIDSEHVVEVHAAGVDVTTGTPFIIMELLRGTELSRRMRSGALAQDEARTIFEQLCHAVGAAHSAGVVHRDLKPENVFLAQSRLSNATVVVKVLDFGIAKLSAEAGTSTAAMGSPLWMPPEQTERTTITSAADVWALGLIAFYMLTGRLFWQAAQFEEPSVHQLLREIVIDPIPSASARAAEIGAPALPPGFDAWFARCVTRKVADRFPNANEAWLAFAQCLGGDGVYPRSTLPVGPLGLTPSGPIVHHQPTPSSGTEIPPTEPMPQTPSAPQIGAGFMATPAPLAATPTPGQTAPRKFGAVFAIALIALAVLGVGGALAARRFFATPVATTTIASNTAPTSSTASGMPGIDAAVEQLVADAPVDASVATPRDASDIAPLDKPRPGPVVKQPSNAVAINAINQVLPNAQRCVSYGSGNAEVTFKSDGSVRDVYVSGIDGTSQRTCIKNALMKARVPPFSDPSYQIRVAIQPN